MYRCCALWLPQELQSALDEARDWVEHLMDELDTSQALVLSFRRELQSVKRQRPDAETPKP